jgi:hypothetical protein
MHSKCCLHKFTDDDAVTEAAPTSHIQQGEKSHSHQYRMDY